MEQDKNIKASRASQEGQKTQDQKLGLHHHL